MSRPTGTDEHGAFDVEAGTYDKLVEKADAAIAAFLGRRDYARRMDVEGELAAAGGTTVTSSGAKETVPGDPVWRARVDFWWAKEPPF